MVEVWGGGDMFGGAVWVVVARTFSIELGDHSYFGGDCLVGGLRKDRILSRGQQEIATLLHMGPLWGRLRSAVSPKGIPRLMREGDETCLLGHIVDFLVGSGPAQFGPEFGLLRVGLPFRGSLWLILS